LFAAGSISLTAIGVTYSQDFNSLANTGTSSAVPNGWDFIETGSNANVLYTAGTGSSATGDTYSFGSAGSSERAFGGLRSGTVIPIIGAQFTNNTGGTINSLTIAYTGEEWRLGVAARTDRLDFQLSTNATSLTLGTWVDYDSLDFTTPNTVTTGAKDGNLAGNRTSITFTITGLSIPNTDSFWIRWTDLDATGADDGLVVDDFSLIPLSDPPIIDPPVVSSMLRANTSPTNAASVDFTVTFSKAVTVVDSTDFTLSTTGISAATITGVSGSGTTYTVSVNTGTGSGTLRLDVVDDDTIIDSLLNPLGGVGSGNGNFSTGETYTIDKSAPSIAIASTSVNPTNISPIPVTFTFSEAVTGFLAGDVTVVNGTVNNFSGSGSTYSANIIPISNGSITIDVAAGAAVDAAGNGNTAASQFSIIYDSIAPTVTVEQASAQLDPTGSFPIHFTTTFTEPINVSTFTASDVLLSGTAGASTSEISQIAPHNGTTFNIAVSGMSVSGTVRAALPANAVRDVAGNNSTSSTSIDNTVTYDITAPNVSSVLRTNASPTNAASVNFTVTFSKAVTGIDGTDFTVDTTGISGAAVTGVSGSGTTYTVTVITGSGSGSLRLDVVDDDTITDSVSNPLGGAGAGNGGYTTGTPYIINKSTMSNTAGLIVNEVSNGSSGNKEWIELIVVGSSSTVDLSGWILDDNNGDFDSLATGKGIATGHLRFADPMPACLTGHSLAAVPVGSRIVIYNSADVEGSLTAYPNDPCDSDADGVYYLPVGSNPNNTLYLQQCTDRPRISPTPTNPNYEGCTYSAPAVTWEGMLLANAGDVIQSRRPDGLFYHGFAYGALSVPPAPNFPDGNPSFNISSLTGTNMAYQFGCGNYFSNASGQFTRVNSSLAVAGSANSMLNAAFIRALGLERFNYSDLNDASNCQIEPDVSASFEQSQVDVGELAQLKVILSNPYKSLNGFSLDLIGINLTNNLPVGLTLSGSNPVSNSCGGTFTISAGATSFILSGVNLASINAPGLSACEVVVNVIAGVTGSFTNEILAGDVTSTVLGASGGANIYPASAILAVVSPDDVKTLPGTGFAPGRKTTLPTQPINKAYQALTDVWLEIPKIGIKNAIVGVPLSGKGWDVSWLNNQAGWLEGTAFPTWNGNSVLTAHVYNADGEPGPFENLHQLKWGDQIIVARLGYKEYIYEIRNVKTGVHPDDISALGHKDYPYLTLITCSGYDEKSGLV